MKPVIKNTIMALLIWSHCTRPTVGGLKELMARHPELKAPPALLTEADDSYVTFWELSDIIELTAAGDPDYLAQPLQAAQLEAS